MTDFTGFTPETIDFLWELRMNNNKAWMEENRERYRTVLKEPFDALSAALTKKFLEKKNVPQMDFSISRINRDVRFSKDKSPYKARKWMVLKEPMTKAEQWKFRPVFYFEVMPEGYEYGMGFYEGRPAYMQAFRKKVDAAPDAFERLVKDTAKMKEFVLYGDSYKRPMGKGDYSPAVMDWYQRKSLGLTASREIDDLLALRNWWISLWKAGRNCCPCIDSSGRFMWRNNIKKLTFLMKCQLSYEKSDSVLF